jgi:dihydroflavonol-4-reductase
VEEITGVSAPRLICPMFLAQAVAPLFTAWAFLVGARPLFTRVALDVLSSGCSVSHERATRELGYRPRPLRETLVDTFQWFAESGQLGYALSRRLLEAA